MEELLSDIRESDDIKVNKTKKDVFSIPYIIGHLVNTEAVVNQSKTGFKVNSLRCLVYVCNIKNVYSQLEKDQKYSAFLRKDGDNYFIIVPKNHVESKSDNEKTRKLVDVKEDTKAISITDGMYLNVSIKDGSQKIPCSSRIKITDVRQEDGSGKDPTVFHINASSIIMDDSITTGENINIITTETSDKLYKSFQSYAQLITKSNKTTPLYKQLENSKILGCYVPAGNFVFSQEKNLYPGLVTLVQNKNLNWDADLRYPVFVVKETLDKREVVDGDKKDIVITNTLIGDIWHTERDVPYVDIEEIEEEVDGVMKTKIISSTTKINKKTFIKVKQYQDGNTKWNSKTSGGVNYKLFITDKHIWGPMAKFIHPDMIFSGVVISKDLGESRSKDCMQHDIISDKSSSAGNMIALLETFGLILAPDVSHWLHMFNDFDIIKRKTPDSVDREKMLSYHNPNSAPRIDVRSELYKSDYIYNPLNIYGNSNLINLMECGGGMNPIELCEKTTVNVKAIIAKRNLNGLTTILDKKIIDDLSILDIFRHCKNRDLPFEKLIFYSHLLLNLIYFYTMDANEDGLFSDKKGDYIEEYQRIINESIKNDYKIYIDDKNECPYKVETFIKHKDILKDFVVAIFIIKTTNPLVKKRKTTEVVVDTKNKKKK